MYNVYLFGLEFTIKPVAFTIPIGKNGWDVYWYGIIIALGFLLAIIYGMKNAKKFNIDVDRMMDVALVTTPLAILCARAYYVIFDGQKINSVSEFFGFQSGSGFSGLAIYGGVIGAFVIGALMCFIRKVNILDMFDVASIGFLIGQGIGRWGNFINQEAYGAFTGSKWWGMQSNRTIAEEGVGLVHPCFLYESVWCLLGAFLLHKFSKKRKFSGQIALMYGIWYGIGRAIIELLRTDSLMIGAFKVSCLLSILLCLACATVLVVVLSRIRANSGEYVSIYGESGAAATDSTDENSNESQEAADEEISNAESESVENSDEENTDDDDVTEDKDV